MRRRRKRGENGGAWGGAGEREAMRRRVGREYEMRAGERQLRLYMTHPGHSDPGGWRGLHMAKTRVTFGRGPDVMVGAGIGHRSARMSHREGAPPTLRSGPVGGSAIFP